MKQSTRRLTAGASDLRRQRCSCNWHTAPTACRLVTRCTNLHPPVAFLFLVTPYLLAHPWH